MEQDRFLQTTAAGVFTTSRSMLLQIYQSQIKSYGKLT